MTNLNTLQTNFASGELDPSLRGQTNLKAYVDGARRLRNVQRRSTGGVERRPGTLDLGPMPLRARLAEFEFSSDQRFALAFMAGGVGIYDINGVFIQLLAGPWTEKQAFELTYVQAGDAVVITHIECVTQLLKRTGPTAFTLTPFAFERSADGLKIYQPYYKFVAATVSLKLDGTALTAIGGDVFQAGHVGQRFRIYDGEVLITAYTSPTAVTATAQAPITIKLDLDPLRTTIGSSTVEVLHIYHGLTSGQSITISGANGAGGIASGSLNGTFTITVVDDLRYTVVAGAAATASADGGGGSVKIGAAAGGIQTRSWLEPSISPVRGYPGACSFHENRLWLAGTPSQPDGVWGSNTFQPFRFDVGKGYDAESVQGAVGSEDSSTVRHLVSNGVLQVMTALRESAYVVRDGEPITPNNQRVKAQATAGSGRIQPLVFDGATLFVQENGLSISELAFSSQDSGYVSTPVSTLAGHLVAKPVSCAASPGTTSRAEQFAYFVNGQAGKTGSDVARGSVTVFHSMRSENIAGWCNWVLGNAIVHSVTCLGQYVFFCVETRGGFRLYRLADEPIVQLDGSVRYVSATATATWTLTPAQRNRDISIVTELGYHGTVYVPADGVITLTVAVTDLVAGDPFYFYIEPLAPVVSVPSGSRVGEIQRIVSTSIYFEQAYSVTINGRRIETRMAGDDFAAAPRPLNGWWRTAQLGYSRSPTTVVTQSEPLAGAVLAVNTKVKV